MDLPDPIGWQLERKQREQERGGRELVRQGQLSPQVCEGRAGEEDAGEGVGKDSGRGERQEREGGKEELEMGGARALWGLGWRLGWPSPTTHAGLSHTSRQCTHSSRHMLSPLWLPSVVPYPQPTGPGHH